MEQFLVVIRGAPASGKTTIAKKFRDFKKKVVWLKVDNFKDFFAQEASLEEQNYVDGCALETLKYLLDSGFSVIMEKIFYDPSIISKAINEANKRNIKNKVFQIKCSLKTLQKRDRERPGVPEGLRKALGDQVIEDLYNQLEKTYYPDAISLNTEELSIDKCVDFIKKELNIK